MIFIHHDEDEYKAIFRKIIDGIAHFYDLLNLKCHTNYNESFHSLLATLAPKDINWNYSWIIRSCFGVCHFCAILAYFSGAAYPDFITKYLIFLF